MEKRREKERGGKVREGERSKGEARREWKGEKRRRKRRGGEERGAKGGETGEE